MIFPGRLVRGDTVGVISPAGPPDPEKLGRAVQWLISLGLRVRLGRYVSQKKGYLAGEDEERLEDFYGMFADPSVKAVFCSRGGYGSARFADRINYSFIRDHPKIFWGYSDITYLHTAIRQLSGLVTFHGPMLASDLGGEEVPVLSKQLFSQLFQPIFLRYDESISPLSVISGGAASGELTGGNLSLLVSTLGTPFELDTRGKLLLIEDIGEAPYRIDGMLNQLRLAGKIKQAAGFVIGSFTAHVAANDNFEDYTAIFENYFAQLQKPVVSGFLIGHCQPHFAVPLGAGATLDADRKALWIHPGVS
ncbi:MAG: LD-carboxypeptidase [Sporolactobacillus sp.]